MKVIVGAFLVTWTIRRKLAQSLLFPAALLVLLTLLPYFAGGQMPTMAVWLIDFFYLMVSCSFAVICHRAVLLDSSSGTKLAIHWSQRETRFLILVLLIALMFVLAIFLLLILMTAAGFDISAINDPKNGPTFAVALILMAIPVIYVSARLSLIFPATAVDEAHTLKWAWEQSRHNGWRLAVVVGGLPFVFSQLLGLFTRQNATVLETVLLSLAGIVIVVVEVAALSLSYRELAKGGKREQAA